MPAAPLDLRTAASGDDIRLSWIRPHSASLGDVQTYRIYKGTTPRGIDLVTAYAEVNATQSWFLDARAANRDPEVYYIVRAVNDTGGAGPTSNTAGAFTIRFHPGVNTLSLPLEPFAPFNLSSLWSFLGAVRLRTLVSGGWRSYPGIPSSPVRVGQGLIAEFSVPTIRVFVGSPASMIQYYGLLGFDLGTIQSLQAEVTAAGDVRLTWGRPAREPGLINNYCISRSPTRQGFHQGTATMLGCTPMGHPEITEWVDAKAAAVAGEIYYLVTPPAAVSGIGGSSAYSIGVWTASYGCAEAFGLPQKPFSNVTVDSLADGIRGALGVSFYSNGSWIPHFREMPVGVYDAVVKQGEGLQLQVPARTLYSFVGT